MIGLTICLFIACAICICLTVHVRFIYTYFCPLKGIRTCCRLFSQKFGASNKRVPQTIHELEEQVSGTRRAQKIARRVNQSNNLKEFGQISPRLNDFIVDLRQEEISTVWSVGTRNSNPVLITHAHSARLKTRLDANTFSEELNFDRRSKKVTCFGPACVGPSQNSFVSPCNPPHLFAGDKATEPNRSLLGSPELVCKFDNQVEKLESANIIERKRANSVGQISHTPYPQIKCVTNLSNAYQDY